jgi:hypothetical protein
LVIGPFAAPGRRPALDELFDVVGHSREILSETIGSSEAKNQKVSSEYDPMLDY